MRLVFVLFDSLNRLALGCYGGTAIQTPNFNRFAERAVTFDNHYVGSLPCMPARRDLHSGRLNFPHRSWGPLEPFDNSFAQILSQAGTHTHMVSDHLHYFEDGGVGYHTRYDTWDFVRGQEYDPWKAMVSPPLDRFRDIYAKHHYDFSRAPKRLQHAVNREFIREEQDFPGPRCFASAFDFLDANHGADNWLLQLELFDPHEPFHAPERFRQAYLEGYNGPILDWPHYERVVESPEEVRIIRGNYAALVAMCDDYFGRLLDYFDEKDMWQDTALVMTTDHGFLLSEHEWWGKCRMPYYDEVSHIPLAVYHPDFASFGGQRRACVTQTMDLMPTFLEMFGQPIPKEVRGRSVLGALADDPPGERVVAFGVFGGPIGVTDGRWVLFHYPPDFAAEGLYEYTLLPMHMSEPFSLAELRTSSFHSGFDFTKSVPLLKIKALPDAKRVPMNDGLGFEDCEWSLFDLEKDPTQHNPLREPEVERRLYAALADILKSHDTPAEAIDWYGLKSLSA